MMRRRRSSPPAADALFCDEKLLIYMAPDVGGPNRQFISVMRLARDPSVIVAVVYTDIIEATDGWVDGVYVITDGELEAAPPPPWVDGKRSRP